LNGLRYKRTAISHLVSRFAPYTLNTIILWPVAERHARFTDGGNGQGKYTRLSFGPGVLYNARLPWTSFTPPRVATDVERSCFVVFPAPRNVPESTTRGRARFIIIHPRARAGKRRRADLPSENFRGRFIRRVHRNSSRRKREHTGSVYNIRLEGTTVAVTSRGGIRRGWRHYTRVPTTCQWTRKREKYKTLRWSDGYYYYIVRVAGKNLYPRPETMYRVYCYRTTIV